MRIENQMKFLRCMLVLTLLCWAPAATAGPSGKAPREEIQTFQVHVTNTGDTLRSVAGRGDVLQDPLKWILLYRLNRDELARLKFPPARLADAPLPAGLNLIFMSPSEARKQAMANAAKGAWVISLMPDKRLRRIESLAARLADQGYHAHILRVASKKLPRYVLRAGFFPNRAQAEQAGRKMNKLAGLTPFRPLKAPLKEIREFRGYID